MINSVIDDLVVVKRSGQRVNFVDAKVALAIKRGFDAVFEEYDEKNVNLVKESVIARINEDYASRKTIGVEDIQDIIEEELKNHNFDIVYEAYQNYREKRSASRELFSEKQQHKFLKAIENLGFDNTLENKQVPMQMMMHFGYTVSKEFAKAYLVENKFVRAHDEGSIYICNLEYVPMGTTANTNIDLQRLFSNSFKVGQAQYRKPNDIMSYVVLALVSIRANQNNQHSGQTIGNFDYYMAKGVLKTFKKQFKKNINDYFELEGFIELLNTNKIFELIDKLDTMDLDVKMFENFYEKSYRIKELVERAYSKAIKITDELTYQAMESFLHNLNGYNYEEKFTKCTINFGTDTSVEGRMVSENLLKCLKRGLGEGYTAKLPIVIFKIKDGVNFNSGDPNYDLYKLAQEVALVRLYPNFSFVDSSFNKKFNSEVIYNENGNRVMDNFVDSDKASGVSRGILSTTVINLARIGIKYGVVNSDKNDLKGFYEELENVMYLIKNQLLQRFEIQCSKKVDDFNFLLKEGVWLDSDKLTEDSKIRKVLRQGNFNIGFVGLAECVKALVDKYHHESDEATELAVEIVKFMRKKCNEISIENRLNFMLCGTYDKEICEYFLAIDKSIYGVIKGVTDKDCYTESFVVASKKANVDNLKVEGLFHKETSGGHLSFIDVSSDDAGSLEKMLAKAKSYDVGYVAINRKVTSELGETIVREYDDMIVVDK